MNEKNLQGQHIAIIGAGIVGSCCAAQLILQGAKVTLIDRAMPGMAGPSRGNAAHIAAPEIIPMATPGIVTAALGMLIDPKSPLKVPLTQWPMLVPWLWRFALNSQDAIHQQNIKKLGNMNAHAFQDVEDLFASTNLAQYLNRDGALYLYESTKSLAAAAVGFAKRAEYGFTAQALSTDQLYDLEPNLAKMFSGGYLLPQWMTVSDPKKIVTGLVDFCCANGGEFICEEVAQFNIERQANSVTQGIELVYKNGQQCRFDKVVLSAGVWSKPLLKQLNTPKLIEAERGYNLTYTDPQINIARAIMFGDRGVVATPIDHGLRIGGWAEFGGVKRRPNAKHFTAIDKIARELFPALQPQENYRWMGHRPSTPDSLPIIERSEASPNIIYALGHGHLGLTQGPSTAKMVAALLTGELNSF